MSLNEFVFERDSGIVFEHAQPSDQPFQLKNNQFTTIPKLESVNAETYNKQFEEMRKAMPKNLAYSGKFGTSDIIPPAVSSKPSAKSPSPVQPPKPPVTPPPVTPKPVAPVKPAVSSKPTTPVQATTPVKPTAPAKPVPEKTVSKPVSETPKPKKQSPVKKAEEEKIEFYTGYQPEKDPFSDETYKNQEMLIKDHKKEPEAVSFKEKFKRTFKKLFATTAEDEYVDYDDEE